MANFGLSLCGCLCACFLITFSNFAILFGLLLFGVGMFITIGLNTVIDNEAVNRLLEQLTQLLQQAQVNISISDILRTINSVTGSVGIVFIILGVVIVVVSFTGCIGACCKVRACLIVYSVIIGIFFVAQLTVVIIWYADSNVLKKSAKTAMEASVSRYTGYNSNNAESLLQNLVQMFIGCCGVNNGSDFDSVNWDRKFFISQGGRNFTFNLTYPVTCCKFDLATMKLQSPYCPYNDTQSNSAVGCYDKLFNDYIDRYFLNYLFPALAGALVLLLMLFAGSLVIYFAQSPANNEPNRVTPSSPPQPPRDQDKVVNIIVSRTRSSLIAVPPPRRY